MIRYNGFRSIVTILALGVASATSAPAAPVLPGLMGMTTTEEVWVVYPAEPAGGNPLARLSAQRRAAYLVGVFGAGAEAVADTELSPELAASRDLLLLGWDNAWLRDPKLDGAIRTIEGRRVAFDQLKLRPGEDLAFAAASPFGADRRLFFWSRIDPELDRFHVLPLTGSDWAVYRDYTVVHQGMFDKRGAWPLIPNVDGARDSRSIKRPFPERRSSRHYTLHGRPREIDDAAAEAILETREAALAKVAERLGGIPDGFRIDLYVYPDDEGKLELTSVPDPTHIVPGRYELHMVRRFADSENPHEDSRLLARARFGPCYLTAMCEGLAVYLEQPRENTELMLFGAAMLDRDILPTLDQILDEEAFRRLGSSGVAYPTAALIFTWLEAQSGLDAVGRVYGLREGSAAAIRAALGRDGGPFDADAAFRSWLAEHREALKDELEFRKLIAQAQKLKEDGESRAAMEALRRASEAKPDDALTVYKLGLAAMDAGDLAVAESSFLRLAGPPQGPVDERYRGLAMCQMGRLRERQQQTAEALDWFTRALAEPDRHGSHAMALEAIESIESTSPVDP